MYPKDFDKTCRRMVLALKDVGMQFMKSTFKRKTKNGDKYMSGELTWVLDEEQPWL